MNTWLSAILKRGGRFLLWWLDVLGRNPPVSHDCFPGPWGGPPRRTPHPSSVTPIRVHSLLAPGGGARRRERRPSPLQRAQARRGDRLGGADAMWSLYRFL